MSIYPLNHIDTSKTVYVGSSFPYAKVVLASALQFGEIQHSGRRVYVNRMSTRDIQKYVGAGRCQCDLDTISDYYSEVLQKGSVSSFCL